MNCILAIDIGTTSAKALVVTADGNVIASAQQGYPTYYPHHGWAEQNPEEVLSAVENIVLKCTATHQEHIAGISFSSAMHSLMAVDSLGVPTTPLVIWADGRSTAQAKALRGGALSEFIYATSGTPIHPMSPLCKLLWLKENQPDVLRNSFKFISIKEFVVYRLSGKHCVDYSIASATGLFDIHRKTWSPEILSEAGIAEKQLSTCVSPYQKLPLTNEATKRLGLKHDTVIVMGASDGCLANLGSGAMGEGELSLTVGTSGAVRMASQQPSNDKRQRVFNYLLDEKTFITGGATNNGLVLIDWFQRMLGLEPMNIHDFVHSATKSSTGANGLLFLPFVFGERAPYYDADMRGVFFGLAQHHTKDDMRRAIIEGICFELRTIMDSVEDALRPVGRILASGGITRSEPWLQVLSNVLNKEVALRDVNDASALGAGLIGFRALAIPAEVSHSDTRTFRPEGEACARYQEFYRIFIHVNTALMPQFGAIAALQK